MKLILVLDNIRSLLNVGAIFRTAEAFKVSEVVLTGITPKPPRQEISKAALGAEEVVKWSYFTSSVEAIKSLADPKLIIALEQTKQAKNIFHWPLPKDFPGNLVLIVGHEREGVEIELLKLADLHLEIPMLGIHAKSLNVATAIGIVLFELRRQEQNKA